MLALELFSWWYTRGWTQLVSNLKRRMTKTSHMFSVPTLLATLFAPWKRIVSYPGSSPGDHMRALVDNLISRTIGFAVRVLVLFTAGLMLLIVGLVGLVSLVLWPLVPPGIVVLLVLGIA